MSKKRPSLVMNKRERLLEAKEELSAESGIVERKPPKVVSQSISRTTLALEAGLLCAIKEVALNRKKRGQKPSTVSGIMREALIDIVIESKLSPDKT